MKKITFIVSLILFYLPLFCQVGISTATPAATLDIVATNPTGTNPEVDGIILPRVDRQRALAMVTIPTSTLIYVDNIATGTATGTAINITSVGFYFFDGTVWQRLTTGINRNWELTGNTATNPTINFLGTTDAQPLIFRTNNLERARILSDGRVSFNNASPLATDRFSVYNTSNTDYVINGYSSNAGVGVFGLNNGGGAGLYGFNSGTGAGVLGINNSTTGTSGAGVYGDSANINSASIFGNAAVNGATAIYGQSTSGGPTKGVYAYTSSNSRRSYPIYGYNGITNSGTAFSSTNIAASIYGDAVIAGNYKFGVVGDGGTSFRSGGVLGNNYGMSLGALGYYNSGGLNYSVYGFGIAYTIGALGGKSSNNSFAENNQIGLGIYGGVMGGWVRGLKYGFHTKGETYSLYIDGAGFTNTPLALLINTEAERTIAYMNTSIKPEINTNGKTQLTNGKIYVSFEDAFSKVIDSEEININLTAQGNSQGLYVTDISENGFWIYENQNGSSDIKVFWTASSVLKSFKNLPVSKDLLAKDFDAKMDKVMFNDNNTNESAQPIWWDGSKIRWDKTPVKKGDNLKDLSEIRKLPVFEMKIREKK
jgi:hypothetical protein